MAKLRIRMLSSATSVSGQGVGSAYMEQVALVREQADLFEVYENGQKGKSDINHVHTVNPTYRLRMDKHHVNVIYVHFIPSTLDGSLRFPKPIFSIFKKYVIGTYRKADEVVVVNPSFIPPLVELGIPEENITYIPNYVSKDQFHSLPKEEVEKIRASYGVDKDAFVVLGCGQVQTRKGVLDYIECAKHNPDLTFVWAGGFSFGKITDGYEELKAIMDNPPSNVKFIGIIDRAKMNDVFNMADMLFMPSLSELFPMSILEAVNCSKPVLLRDLELYEGILFSWYRKAHDVDGFSSEIRKLYENKDYYEESAKLSDKIAAFYSKEHVAALWREYYPRIYKKWATKKKLPPLE
ncbi:MAG: glycosyltransferase family 4 protein [Bacilli bacterium]|nr:glycosyltransferase family 4 protein [Bacilli bacterium]